MATVVNVVSNQIVDSAIGPINVIIQNVTGFDVDDYVTTTVQSIAITIQMYNLANNVNTKFTQNRRKVSIAGVTVGGY